MTPPAGRAVYREVLPLGPATRPEPFKIRPTWASNDPDMGVISMPNGGRGPAPKDPSRRARTNKDPIATTVLPFQRAGQPDLPDSEDWPAVTVAWWVMWGESAQAELMTATDWSFLMDTALIHRRFWLGDLSQAPELRLRVAKFGATLEDRARLRITFADADKADAARPAGAPVSSRERRGALVALPSTTEPASA